MSCTQTLSLVTVAISPSLIIKVRRVLAIIAGISDAIKFSPLPKPITKGLDFFVQISFPGSLAHINTNE